MHNTESLMKTLELAAYTNSVKDGVLELTTSRPPFHLYNYQYMFMNDYSVKRAIAAIVKDLNKKTA